MKAELIYIAGHGRSGSTLLDVLLSQHPSVAGLGEAHRASQDPATRLTADGFPVAQSPFWHPIICSYTTAVGGSPTDWDQTIPLHETRTGTTSDRAITAVDMLPAPLRRIGLLTSTRYKQHDQTMQRNWRFFDTVRTSAPADIVIDSTKSAGRLIALERARPGRTLAVHLVRDPRAVAASLARRSAVPAKDTARAWVAENRKVRSCLRLLDPAHVMTVTYESVCTDPVSVCEQIRRRAGVAEPGVTHDRPLHQIPGSDWLLDDPSRFRNVRHDLRWRTQLSPADVADIEGVAASEMRRYGYLSS